VRVKDEVAVMAFLYKTRKGIVDMHLQCSLVRGILAIARLA